MVQNVIGTISQYTEQELNKKVPEDKLYHSIKAFTIRVLKST